MSFFICSCSFFKTSGSPGPFDKNTPSISFELYRSISLSASKSFGITSTPIFALTISFKIFLFTPKSITTIFASGIGACSYSNFTPP